MSAASALLAQQPVAFWLAVVGVLTAAAIALGSRLAVAAALAAALGALVAVIAPAAPLAQAAGAGLGAAAVLGLGLARRRSASAEGASKPSLRGDVRLLGRTARTRAAFVGGEGEVDVDGAARRARVLAPDEVLGGEVLVRIVRVGDAALVVRPVAPPAG